MSVSFVMLRLSPGALLGTTGGAHDEEIVGEMAAGSS